MAQENTKILSAPKGSSKKKHRVGRGQGSGWGCTAGRGDKGAQSRAGYSRRAGFEGGQMPLYRRIAQRGFSNSPFKKEFAIINLVDLEAKYADGETVNRTSLKEKGLVGKIVDGIKVLGNGEISKKLTVEVEKISASAKEKIEKAGGSVKVIAEKSAKAK